MLASARRAARTPEDASTNETLDLLRAIPLFAGQGERGMDEIARLVRVVDVPAGRQLTREGEPGEDFFVIVEGSVGIERGGQRLRTMGPGEFLGEIALVDGGPRTATATTESIGRLLVISRRDFDTLLERFPTIQDSVMQALADRVRRLEPDAGQ